MSAPTSKLADMAEAKKKCRQYKVDYLKFGFVPLPTDHRLPKCLLCDKVLGNESMKPAKLGIHLRACHPELSSKDLAFFRSLNDRFTKQPSVGAMFASSSKSNDDGLTASYNISLLIAKSGSPHTIGEELILPAIGEAIRCLLHKPARDFPKKIPLSNSSVQRRIDEMADDVENTLCTHPKGCPFSIQLDESTLPDNQSLLLVYVRFIKDQKICEELLFARTLTTDTRGESIFKILEGFLCEKQIPMANILSAAVDGAPAMFGRYRGILSYPKRQIPNLLTIHCVIHRQHLVARNLSSSLHESLQFVIRAVNLIRSPALNSRLFAQLCEENGEEFKRLVLHTEVRWLRVAPV